MNQKNSAFEILAFNFLTVRKVGAYDFKFSQFDTKWGNQYH